MQILKLNLQQPSFSSKAPPKVKVYHIYRILPYYFTTINLLTLADVATTLPLYWFARAARILPLSTVGFIQYLSPTISLFIAVFLFHEPFTKTHWLSFGFIWSALIVFTLSSLRSRSQSVSASPNLALKKRAQ
ncbi:EamA family transporter [Brevibacillus ruminantium]|uniref:EamA family transporter n=1 Tax=Brevibacillus ruminantium TaxID=2950604 RepID=A0ABY4WL42_9BACL|nr:EamA family transporter [Brevibacillus ruminantium]USG67486.1 EamA family transporter [Brevibacillus ruminantium]